MAVRLRDILEYRAELAPREAEVERLVAEGLCNKEIGQRMGISHNAVRNYLQKIFLKRGVDSRLKLAVDYVRRNG